MEMTDTFGEFARAEYDRFVVEGEATNFTLDVGGFRGSTVAAVLDSLFVHDGQQFSFPPDEDNDALGSRNCVLELKSPGW